MRAGDNCGSPYIPSAALLRRYSIRPLPLIFFYIYCFSRISVHIYDILSLTSR